MTPAERRRSPVRATARSLFLVGTVLALAAAGPGPAKAAPAHSVPGADHPANVPATSVMLPTGDLVRLRTGPDGKQAVTVLPRDRHGIAGAFRTEQRNGDIFVYPGVAQPYLGRLLDPAMFNVSQLARDGYTTAASRIPVRLAWATAGGQHAVPGVTILHTQGASSDGYLDWAAAKAFGQALAAQVRADAAAHWAIGGGMFAGLTGIRFAGAIAAPPVLPHFPMFTLRLLITGADGLPAPVANVRVMNVDDMRRVPGLPVVQNGEARISVPAGHYSLFALTFDSAGDDIVVRTVVVTDFQVTKAQTQTVDMRTATIAPAARTPRPAMLTDGDLAWLRTDALGASAAVVFPMTGGFQALFAPAEPPRFGSQHVAPRFRLDSPAAAPQPYTYDLRYDTVNSSITSLTYEVTPAQLTTLHSRYHADGPRLGAVSTRQSFLPWLPFGFATLLPVTVPGERTEYLNGQPDVEWAADYAGFNTDSVFLADELVEFSHGYAAGAELTVDWDAPIIHTGLAVNDHSTSPGLFICDSCRQGDRLSISPAAVIDSEPRHFGLGLDTTGDTPYGPVDSTTRWRLYRDGTLISDQAGTTGQPTDVPAADAAYRILFDETRIAPWHTQAIRSSTEYTFRSAHAGATSVPANWICADRTNTGCAAVSLLNLGYRTQVDLTNQAPPGPQHLNISVTHSPGIPDLPISTATVEVSFDDGGTWTPATVTGGNGQYDATFTAPSPGFVSTRVHATDAAGTAITQTVVRAYTIGAAA